MLQVDGETYGVISRTLLAPERLASAPVEVWFTGSSQIREAVDPVALAPALGAVVNAGASGKNPCRALHEQRALRAHAPPVIVLGLSYFDFDNTKCTLSHPMLLGATGGRLPADLEGLLPAADEAALARGAAWPWLATRPWQRNALLARLRSPLRGAGAPSLDTPFRYEEEAAEPVARLRARWRAAPETFETVDVEGPAPDAIRRSIEGWQAAGSRVVVVAMPLHPEVTSSEREPAAASRLDAVLSTLATELGVEVYDWEDAFAPSQFYDITHLNAEGRAAFGARIVEVLADPPRGE
jgi:hypothetical protein